MPIVANVTAFSKSPQPITLKNFVHSIPVLSLTRLLKVSVYFGENSYAPFSSIYSVIKVSHSKYFDCYLAANNFIKNNYGILASQCNISFVGDQ